jgi:hypothetical protein
MFAPLKKRADRAGVCVACVPIPNVYREELDEPPLGLVTGTHHEIGESDAGIADGVRLAPGRDDFPASNRPRASTYNADRHESE